MNLVLSPFLYLRSKSLILGGKVSFLSAMLDLHELLTLEKFGCIGSHLSEGRKPGIRAFDDINFLRLKIKGAPFHLHTLPSLPNRT